MNCSCPFVNHYRNTIDIQKTYEVEIQIGKGIFFGVLKLFIYLELLETINELFRLNVGGQFL